MLFFTLGRDDANGKARQEDSDEADAALVRAARGGDGHAFETLIRKYEKFVYRTAYYACGNEEDAADLTQEILLKIWHGLPSYQGNSRFLTWLVRVARNTCCDYVRKQQRSLPTQPLDILAGADDDAPRTEVHDPSPDADPHGVYTRRENTERIRDAMTRLSEEHRMMIVMRDINGDSYETIAAALGLEVGTVKSRLSRARKRLRDLLADMGFFEKF